MTNNKKYFSNSKGVVVSVFYLMYEKFGDPQFAT